MASTVVLEVVIHVFGIGLSSHPGVITVGLTRGEGVHPDCDRRVSPQPDENR